MQRNIQHEGIVGLNVLCIDLPHRTILNSTLVLRQDSFWGFPMLQVLSLTECELTEIKSSAFHFNVMLKEFLLSGNRIVEFPGDMLQSNVLLEEVFVSEGLLNSSSLEHSEKTF